MKQQIANWLRRYAFLQWGLRVGVYLFAPRHHVGVAAAIFNDAGQVLLVEHVFRPRFPWGLPGGWLEPGENPAEAVRRELEEELGLHIEVKRLVHCEPQGRGIGVPPGVGLAYYCRLPGNKAGPVPRGSRAYEILSTRWLTPGSINLSLTPLDRQAIILAKQEFDREQISTTGELHANIPLDAG